MTPDYPPCGWCGLPVNGKSADRRDTDRIDIPMHEDCYRRYWEEQEMPDFNV